MKTIQKMKPIASYKFKKDVENFLFNAGYCDEFYLIILVESHFRPLLFRLFEYLLYFFFILFIPKKSLEMTLGLCQLRVTSWIEYFEDQKLNFDFLQLIKACENINTAKNAAKFFFESNKFNLDKTQELSTLYTGRKNYYYDQMFSYARALNKTLK